MLSDFLNIKLTSDIWDSCIQGIDEGKQVGVIYHFTQITNLKNMLDKEVMDSIGCEIFDFLSYNTHLSTTRNFQNPRLNFDPHKWNVRICLDGDKLSNNWKIKPINGLINNDSDIFNKDNPRVSHKLEREEVCLNVNGKLNIKKYIKQIDIRLPSDEYTEIINDIKIKCQELGVICSVVRSFDKVK